jgi:hypothetical protein
VKSKQATSNKKTAVKAPFVRGKTLEMDAIMFVRNVDEQQRCGSAWRVHLACFFVDLLHDSDDGKNTSFRNVFKQL